MRDHMPHGLELRWVEVRDDRGSHMEAHWSAAAAAPAPDAQGAAAAPAATHAPHAA